MSQNPGLQQRGKRGEEEPLSGPSSESSSIRRGGYGSTSRSAAAPSEAESTPTTTSTLTNKTDDEERVPWWRKFTTLELENKGSVARDHLALERTFLAWLRTSLAFASIGVAITQLFRLVNSNDGSNKDRVPKIRQMGKPLGASFLGIAILILALGAHRYYESQEWLQRGKFPASRGGIILATSICGLIMIASLVIVLAVGSGDFET